MEEGFVPPAQDQHTHIMTHILIRLIQLLPQTCESTLEATLLCAAFMLAFWRVFHSRELQAASIVALSHWDVAIWGDKLAKSNQLWWGSRIHLHAALLGKSYPDHSLNTKLSLCMLTDSASLGFILSVFLGLALQLWDSLTLWCALLSHCSSYVGHSSRFSDRPNSLHKSMAVHCIGFPNVLVLQPTEVSSVEHWP